MNENFDISSWDSLVKNKRDEILEKLKELKIPVIFGSIHGGGSCIITAPLLKPFNLVGVIDIEQYKNLLSEGSLAVIDIESNTVEEVMYLAGISTYIRLGTSNTYLHASIESIFNEEEDLDSEYVPPEPEISDEEILRMAIIVATEPGFGVLKNKNQREDFAESVLKKIGHEFESFTTSIISYRAEAIYEFGILPTKVKSLCKEGKSINEISKSIGVTKSRAEKSRDMEIPEYILEILKDVNI